MRAIVNQTMDRVSTQSDSLSLKIFNTNDSGDETSSFTDELNSLRLENARLRKSLKLQEGLRQRFETLYDNSPLGYLTLSGENYIVEANLTLAHLLGVRRNQLIGQQVSHIIAEKDQAVLNHHLNHVRAQNVTDACHLHMVNSNGKTFEARLESVPTPKEAHYRFSTIYISVNCNQHHNTITRSNPQLAYLEESKTVELAATNRDLINEIHHQEHKEEELNKHQEKLEDLINQHVHKIEAMSAQLDKEISRRKIAEKKDRQHQEHLVNMSRLNTAGKMASELVHEINQPLTAILTYVHCCLSRLQKGDTSGHLKETLEQIAIQTQRAANIIQHLRDFVIKGKSCREKTDLTKIVGCTVNILRNDIIKNKVRLDISQSKSIPQVEADPVQIEQVILILMSNAIDAMKEVPADTRTLYIEIDKPDNSQVFVTIRDTGPGIRKEYTGKIFTPFFSTKKDGIGLGLAMSKTIIEEHGGQLTHTTNAAGGATFKFTLPIQDPQQNISRTSPFNELE